MGNRAVITAKVDMSGVGVYLHWNGGRDSVEAFLTYCKMKGYSSPDLDNYGWAMLAGVITNFFADGHSCGVDLCRNLDCDNYDNGVFVIADWMITARVYKCGGEQYEHDLMDFIKAIDKAQPEPMRLTQDEWKRFDEVKALVEQARKNTQDIK